MAIVQKRAEDKKYAHLKKVYVEKNEDNKAFEKVEPDAEVKLPVKKLELTRKQLLQDAGWVLLVVLISTSGYLLTKIV